MLLLGQVVAVLLYLAELEESLLLRRRQLVSEAFPFSFDEDLTFRVLLLHSRPLVLKDVFLIVGIQLLILIKVNSLPLLLSHEVVQS